MDVDVHTHTYIHSVCIFLECAPQVPLNVEPKWQALLRDLGLTHQFRVWKAGRSKASSTTRAARAGGGDVGAAPVSDEWAVADSAARLAPDYLGAAMDGDAVPGLSVARWLGLTGMERVAGAAELVGAWVTGTAVAGQVLAGRCGRVVRAEGSRLEVEFSGVQGSCLRWTRRLWLRPAQLALLAGGLPSSGEASPSVSECVRAQRHGLALRASALLSWLAGGADCVGVGTPAPAVSRVTLWDVLSTLPSVSGPAQQLDGLCVSAMTTR
jgi:hypothetical protein